MSDRPHCKNPDACPAKTVGKHCPPCAARTPECLARRRESQRIALLDPEARARRVAGAKRTLADPEITERRRAGIIAALSDPEVKKRHKDGCAAAMERRLADPAEREALRKLGYEHGLANLRQMQSGPVRERAAANIRAKHLAWCPPEYWSLNEKLKSNGFLLPERKAMIAAEIEHQRTIAARRAIADFDREQRARRQREKAQAY